MSDPKDKAKKESGFVPLDITILKFLGLFFMSKLMSIMHKEQERREEKAGQKMLASCSTIVHKNTHKELI